MATPRLTCNTPTPASRAFSPRAEFEATPASNTADVRPLAAPEEIVLARHLLNFGLTLEAVAEEYRPNFLCNYLYELAGQFARFYENCPVLKAEPARARQPPGLVRFDRARLEAGPGRPGHRDAGTDVS